MESGTGFVSPGRTRPAICAIWNAMIDRHPALIARCEGAADVSNAITFARERNLLVSVRGGGHSISGKSVCEGGLMIDMSNMNSVHVDQDKRTARADGACLEGHIDHETSIHRLATTGGIVSHTGAVGRVGSEETAFPHRAAHSNMMCWKYWFETETMDQRQERIASVRDDWARLEPYTHGFYVNLNDDSETKTYAT